VGHITPLTETYLEDMDDGGDSGDVTSPDNHLISSQNVTGKLQKVTSFQNLSSMSTC